MRFTGQVKIPDLDYPGLPAEVLVEDKQTELFVAGESLGRWSLVDVRAERLISSAFSLRLGPEEVTFIADQPTEFAYSGVDKMAKVWATHRSKRFPVRAIANSRSRKGTKPSRINDLREAIEEAIAGHPLTALPTTSGDAGSKPHAHKPQVETPEARERRRSSAYRPAEPTPPPTRQAGFTRDAAESPGRADEKIEADPVPKAPDTPDSVFAEPEASPASEPPASDSIYKDSVPWAKETRPPEGETEGGEPSARRESIHEESTPEEPARFAPEPDVSGEESPASEDDAPVRDETPSPPREPQADRPSPAPEPDPRAAPSEPVDTDRPAEHVPWMAPPEETQAEAPAARQGAEPPIEPDDPEIPAPESAKGQPSDDDREYVVDLGAFEDAEEGEPPVEEDEPVPSAEPAMTAPARGGIIGAVRSAFVRSTKDDHRHEYVEAPGGIGIKRQICAECGHISIGLSE
ncbi:MAG: hypothetical protein DWQ40_06845 [Actinobacteria bacterium]|nr:MAG: hypothetical protein DWQ40_06845 [Actinomycetota bacterium]REK33951.1 MAG: hypothetical protein DWQ20_07220 [Actinomycetota bacterium]